MSLPVPLDFEVGQRVMYDVVKPDGTSFQVPAVVIGHTKARVVIQHINWKTGATERRNVRPTKVRAA